MLRKGNLTENRTLSNNDKPANQMKKQLLFFLLIGSLIGCKKENDHPVVVKACFEYSPNEINDGEVQFTNCSENAVSFLWDFGDGETSHVKTPTHLFSGNFPFTVTLIAYNGDQSNTISKQVYDDIMVYKPNIYIYPLHQSTLSVTITFPIGGEIIESVPDYAEGWFINVDPSGKIDNKYDYLFYESKQPDVFQYATGWCIAQTDLRQFFERNMALYNFSDSEIKDFTDYWIPLLHETKYYCIYPQTNEIVDRIIQLGFSIQPDNVFRLFYGVAGTADFKEMEEPSINPIQRNGFYIVEWGVFRK